MSRRSSSFSDEAAKVQDKQAQSSNTAVNPQTRRGQTSQTWRQQASSTSDRMGGADTTAARGRSRSRSPYRAPRNASRSPFRADRPRSRSPYRPGKETKKKRGRDDDHYGKTASDTRRHKYHYEDNKSVPRAPGFSHAGIGKTGANYSHAKPERSNYGHHAGRGSHGSRARSRSRSPYRHGQERAPLAANGNTRHGATEGNQVDGRTPFPQRESNPPATQDQSEAKAQSSQPTQAASHETSTNEQPALTEAEKIEQRRKRREEIRAKHKGTEEPLLIKVLDSAAEAQVQSAAPTPTADASPQHASPPAPATSPGTPRDASFLGTPPISGAEDMVEPQRTKEPRQKPGLSAADFDPRELEQDRLAHQPAVDEASKDPMPVKDAAAPAAAPVADFNMFDDELDDQVMFAALDTAAHAAEGQTLHHNMDNSDDAQGHYRIYPGELLDGRYKVLQELGRGTFAIVIRALDTKDEEPVAIKIARNNDVMLRAGKREIRILKKLNEADPEDTRHIIRFKREFMHRRHLCYVQENLSMDLRALLGKLGRGVGLSLSGLISHSYQMFSALDHMRKNEILHTDIKPDNILVNEEPWNKIKMIDFGTARFLKDVIEPASYLASRFYRAPEIILGMLPDHSADMWAVGCTLCELYTDTILFRGGSNNDMLHHMQLCLGKFPKGLVKRGEYAGRHWDNDFVFYKEELDPLTNKMISKPVHYKPGTNRGQGHTLKERLAEGIDGGADALQRLHPDDLREHHHFVDLMEKCLTLDPDKRIKPRAAMAHPFFTEGRRGRKMMAAQAVAAASTPTAHTVRPLD